MADINLYAGRVQAPITAKTQRSRILRLSIEAHGACVPLFEILDLGIAQYGARILELRRHHVKSGLRPCPCSPRCPSDKRVVPPLSRRLCPRHWASVAGSTWRLPPATRPLLRH